MTDRLHELFQPFYEKHKSAGVTFATNKALMDATEALRKECEDELDFCRHILHSRHWENLGTGTATYVIATILRQLDPGPRFPRAQG